MNAENMNEAEMVNLVRNALLVAGTEMGETGDHWPVIKSTIHSIAKDWEDLKIERNVSAEIKTHFENMIHSLEMIRKESPKSLQPEIDRALEELKSLSSACFSSIDNTELHFNQEDLAPHIKRAKAIVDTLENDDEH